MEDTKGSQAHGGAAETDSGPQETGTGVNAKTADRLRELDSLRKQGLLTEEEYREKRRRIIEDF